MLKNLFKRNETVITVKQIHDEVDGLETSFLKEVNDILNSNSINKSKEERKSELAMELGFVNSSVVKNAKEITQNRLTLVEKTERAKLLESYKLHYPLDKIIPISLFEDICDKYGLIIAPVENYIKDIPEKNLVELKNSKPTIINHQPNDYYILSKVRFMIDHTSEYENYIKSFIGKDISNYKIDNISEEKKHPTISERIRWQKRRSMVLQGCNF